jgi:hypothetical protein
MPLPTRQLDKSGDGWRKILALSANGAIYTSIRQSPMNPVSNKKEKLSFPKMQHFSNDSFPVL